MKVSELFLAEDISLDMVSQRELDSSYWASSFKFIEQVWTREIETLSKKQVDWVDRILDSMLEWRERA